MSEFSTTFRCPLESQHMDSQHHTRECNYYDWRVIPTKVQRIFQFLWYIWLAIFMIG